jgi:hypothetical protein
MKLDNSTETREEFTMARRNLDNNLRSHQAMLIENEREPHDHLWPTWDDDESNSSNSQKQETPSREWGGIPGCVKDVQFSRNESTDYFGNNYHSKRGAAYLISKSFYSNHRAPEDIPPEDQAMCMQFTLLIKTMTSNQRDMFGDFLQMLFKRITMMEDHWIGKFDSISDRRESEIWCPLCECESCRAKKGISRPMPSESKPVRIPPIPRDALEIRSKISRGKNAFFTLLPYPRISQTNDGHVYVLPSDCIKHFMAHGNVPLEFNRRFTSYPYSEFNDSPRGVEIATTLDQVTRGKCDNKKHFNVSFLEWKDDCESAKSNKTSKHNLWLFTITIFGRGRQKDSPIATYPVALGPKGKSHNLVERLIADDIEKMRTTALPSMLGWYGTSKPVSCTFSADLYISLGDQPERRGGNVLQMGTSKHHARWRHACDYGQLLAVLPACDRCLGLMVECDSEHARKDPNFDRELWRKAVCQVCTNWGRDLSNPMLRFERSKTSPKDFVLGGEKGVGLLSPLLLTHAILIKVMDLTFEMVAEGKWTKVQGIAYLCDNCINQKFASVCVARALNVFNLSNAKRDVEDTDYYRELLRDKNNHPERYNKMQAPSLFLRGVPLRAFLDTPMHLLLLGIVKASFWRITTWAGRRGRKRAFVAFAREMLTQLDDLKLSWLVFIPKTFGDQWGGWVSKNYGSLLRVALWVYGPLLMVPDEPIYTDPVEEPTKWFVPQYRSWLKARGLDSTGNKPELQPRVMNYLLGPPEAIPPIKPILYGRPPEMWEMLKSMVLLVTTLFQDRVFEHTSVIIDLRVRLFLTRFERFEAPMRSTDVRTWLRAYNFLCLLNLPEAVRDFGPVRRWFEGKWLGERYVSTVKNEREKCGPKNVQAILMRNLQLSKSLQEVGKSVAKFDNDDLVLNTRIFDSKDEIQNQFSQRVPLPVVILEAGVFATLYYTAGRSIGRSINAVLYNRSDREDELTELNGLRYWNFKVTEEIFSFAELNIRDYGVLLPWRGSENGGVYTIVTKNWSTEMFGDYDFEKESQIYNTKDRESAEPNQENDEQMKQEEGQYDLTSGWI